MRGEANTVTAHTHTHTHTHGKKKNKTVFTYSGEFPIWHQGIIQVSIGSLEIIL